MHGYLDYLGLSWITLDYLGLSWIILDYLVKVDLHLRWFTTKKNKIPERRISGRNGLGLTGLG